MSNRSANTAWPQLRRAWIERYAALHGAIRRRDICEALGVSLAQASADLQQVLEDNPGCLEYSLNDKTYYWAGKDLRTDVPQFLSVLMVPKRRR